MGEGNFGGNGSVKWDISIKKEGKFNNGKPKPGGPHDCGGTDDDHGSYFVVKLRRPKNATVEEFWTQLVNGGMTIEKPDYVVLKLTIEAQEKTPKQIIINWDRQGLEGTSARTTVGQRAARTRKA